LQHEIMITRKCR